MFMIAYETASGRIMFWRSDSSTVPMTAQQAFEDYSGDKSSVTMLEIPPPSQTIRVLIDMYNPQTGEIYQDPNYVPPSPPDAP